MKARVSESASVWGFKWGKVNCLNITKVLSSKVSGLSVLCNKVSGGNQVAPRAAEFATDDELPGHHKLLLPLCPSCRQDTEAAHKHAQGCRLEKAELGALLFQIAKSLIAI